MNARTTTSDVTASEIDLFRFSAVTWNAHRIHFDQELARREGLPGIVVQAHLHGAWLARVARDLGGPGARLTRLEWRNRAPVTAGAPVAVDATIRDESPRHVSVDLVEHDRAGTVFVTGSATVTHPEGAH